MRTKDQLMLEQAYLQIREGTLSDIGHTVIDIVGLFPGAGEFADVTNAVWYCLEGKYLHASLSLISCIPVIGDIVGKGTKISLFLYKAGIQVKKAKSVIKANEDLIDKIFDKASENEKLAPHVEEMKEAISVFVGKR